MKFDALTNEDLADIWYALAGAEIRHPGCFTGLLEESNQRLFERLGDGLAPFVDQRFAKIRAIDAVEDAEANAKATSEASCE